MNRNQSFPDLKLTETPGKDLQTYSIVNKEILFKVLNGLQFSRYVSIVERIQRKNHSLMVG
jgi:hypothetical protein